jgi:hypothetical protein
VEDRGKAKDGPDGLLFVFYSPLKVFVVNVDHAKGRQSS